MHTVTSDNDKEHASATEFDSESTNRDSNPDDLNTDAFEDAINESDKEYDTSNADPDAITIEGVGNANSSIDEDVEGAGAAPNENNEGVETDIIAEHQKYHSKGRPMQINRRHVKDTPNGTK